MLSLCSGHWTGRAATLIGLVMYTIAGFAWAADVASLYGRTLKCSDGTGGRAELYVSEDGLFLYRGTDKGIRFSFDRERNDSEEKDASYKSKALRLPTEIVYEYALLQKNYSEFREAKRTVHSNQKGKIYWHYNGWRLDRSLWGSEMTVHNNTMTCELVKGHAISPPDGCDNPNFSMVEMRECEGRKRNAVAKNLKNQACSEKVCIYRLARTKVDKKAGGYEVETYSGQGYQFIDGEGLKGNEELPIGARVVDPQGKTTVMGNSGGTCCGSFYLYVSGPLNGAVIEFTMLGGKKGAILTVPR